MVLVPDGMTCASCVGRVEKGVSGIEAVNVNYATGSANAMGCGAPSGAPYRLVSATAAGGPLQVGVSLFDVMPVAIHVWMKEVVSFASKRLWHLPPSISALDGLPAHQQVSAQRVWVVLAVWAGF